MCSVPQQNARPQSRETHPLSAVTYQLTDPVQHLINDLFANGVVSTRVVVGGILLASNQLLGVEELAVDTSPNLI